MTVRRTILLSSLLAVVACQNSEPSPTRGNLEVLATESIAPLIGSVGQDFARIYSNVTFRVHPTSTREAIVHLLNDSVSAVAVDRPLNPEELEFAGQLKGHITTTVWGTDALVVIAHATNPIKSMTSETLGSILRGQVRTWMDVPGSEFSASLNLVMTGRNTGSYELLANRFFPSASSPARAGFEKDEEAVLRQVAGRRFAIGVVSFSTLNRLTEFADRTIAVRLLALDGTAPSQQSIYSKTYPLCHRVLFITRERKAGPAAGFATFLAGINGQKIVQRSGIVPATIPSRTVQIIQEP